MPSIEIARPWLALALLCASLAHAQTTPRPAAAASAPDSAASATQRIEVTGTRGSDTEQRRQSTAAKIVIGREEIDKFGDANVGEVLRRLPGVTTPGAPGRGGPPRMRGLGSGFTQILIDGQRIPPGFSLDSLTPEQIERIEILRAPTAETGAQAIAGTINIITREGFQRRLNDLRIGTGVENGKPSLGTFWSHNDNAGNLTYTLSAGLFANRRRNEVITDTQVTDLGTGDLVEDRTSRSVREGDNLGLNLNARLQWRLGPGGDSLTLQPGLFANQNEGSNRFVNDNRITQRGLPEHAANGLITSDNSFYSPRLIAQYRQRVGDWRLEGGGTLRSSRGSSDSVRNEYRADGSLVRGQDDHSISRERGVQFNAKGSRLLGGEGAEHSLVLGGEIESTQRDDTRGSVVRGRPTVEAELANDFQASVLRVAAFAQDEWNLNAHWSVHAGLRWEGLNTRGDDGQGERPESRTSVTTPLLHLLWKPDPKTRDQVRLSLTRSWRAPPTAQLIGRPSINPLYDPAVRSNIETSPDSAGNPNLKPELATGIDLAFERYLQGGGLLSANLFHREIRDLMRSLVALEDVPWSTFDRYVRRTRNIGSATTQGIELEAKFRLDQVIADTPPVELRANLALFRSKVDSVPGPDNRLDQQSKATGNLGADYRLRGTPLTLGGSMNWVPATTTRLAADQTSSVSTKRQWDVFALWAFSPSVGVRLSANNLLPRDYVTESFNDGDPDGVGNAYGLQRTRSTVTDKNDIGWQLRLELKL